MTAVPAPNEVPAACRDAIVATCPRLARSVFSVAGRGWHSLAVDVDDRLIFKFPEGDEAGDALRREARLLAAVRPFVTMPVPAMAIHRGPPLFSSHEKLPGRTIGRADYARLTEASRAWLADAIALFFAELHAIDPCVMRAAGAERISAWDTGDETLRPIWPLLPPDIHHVVEAALDAYGALGPDPLGEVYGFFDAHGWNMAFDHEEARLRGIFDFADSGFGPLHREFVQVSLIAPDLAARSMRAYAARTGKTLDPRRIFLLTAAMRLSELAGAVVADENVAMAHQGVLDWFGQTSFR